MWFRKNRNKNNQRDPNEIIARFRLNFPACIEPIPHELLVLLDYQIKLERSESKTKFYSGEFSLGDYFWEHTWQVYFPIEEREVTRFIIPFGSDADGSMYAFWLYKNLQSTEIPIIYLDHSYDGSKLIASNCHDFMALLSLGVDSLGGYIGFPGWERQISQTSELQLFRKWLKQELGIGLPDVPNALVEKAYHQHPDFSKWMEDRVGYAPQPFSKSPF